MSYNAIKLVGTLSISGQEEVNNTFDSTSLLYSLSEVARPTAPGDISVNESETLPQYYITLTGDINAFFDVSLSGTSGQDDAWSCTNFTSNGILDISSGTSTITLSDGTTSKDFTVGWVNEDTSGTISIGQIDISTNDSKIIESGITLDGQSSTNETYEYVLQVVMDSEGKLSFTTGAYVSKANSSSTEITISTAQDETLYQQELYMSKVFKNTGASFNGNDDTKDGTTTLGSEGTDPDVKSFTYDFSQHNSTLTEALTTSLSDFSGETLVSKLSIGVNEISQSTNNLLSQWANEQGREGNTDTSTEGDVSNNLLFNQGESIWINTSLGQALTAVTNATLDMRKFDSDGSTYTEVITRTFGVKLIQSNSGARNES